LASIVEKTFSSWSRTCLRYIHYFFISRIFILRINYLYWNYLFLLLHVDRVRIHWVWSFLLLKRRMLDIHFLFILARSILFVFCLHHMSNFIFRYILDLSWSVFLKFNWNKLNEILSNHPKCFMKHRQLAGNLFHFLFSWGLANLQIEILVECLIRVPKLWVLHLLCRHLRANIILSQFKSSIIYSEVDRIK